MDRNTFTKQGDISPNISVSRPWLLQAQFSTPHNLRTVQLLQLWQVLKEREMTAQEHNRQLLQQFEEAQQTLREMLTLTNNMKSIRMEYERYLIESSALWQQQLQENRQAPQRKLRYMPGHHHLWPKQNPPGLAPLQPDYHWSGTTGAAGIPSGSEGLWSQLYVEEPPPGREVARVLGEEAERSTTPSLNCETEVVSRSSNLSQELDSKPVRLPSHPAESSESSRESSQGSREKKRQKRRGLQCSSSSQERQSSQETSSSSSAKATAAVTVAQSSESDVSSERGGTSTRRSAGLAVGSPKVGKVSMERIWNNEDDSEGHLAGEESKREKAGDQSPDNKSESCKEESGSQREEESECVCKDTETGGEMSDGSEESSVAEMDEEHEKYLGVGNEEDGDINTGNLRVEEQEDINDNVSESQNTAEEEEETGADDVETTSEEGDQEEVSAILENGSDGKWSSASSQDEEVDEDDSEGGGQKMEDSEPDKENGEEVESEEQRRAEAEPEERDSEDSIISPQKKSIKMHIIPEETTEEEGSKRGSSDDSNEFSDDDDIEHLLAPQAPTKNKEEMDLTADEKPKALSDKLKIFQVQMETSTKMDPSSDPEFDDFYN